MHATDWLSFIALFAAVLILVLVVLRMRIQMKNTGQLSEWLRIAAALTVFLTLVLAFGGWGGFQNLQLVAFLVGFPAALLLYAASEILEISQKNYMTTIATRDSIEVYLNHVSKSDIDLRTIIDLKKTADKNNEIFY